MNTKLSYKLDKQLANGRYGNIYLAYGKNNERVVVKKVDLIVLKKDDKLLIQQEVSIQKDLISPYIVRFIESCTESGYQYIALEYGDGGDLANLIRAHKNSRQHFSQNDILRWSYQILKGLTVIHSHLIIHRDIKPDNIILSRLAQDVYNCKITDFGLSWKLENIADTCTSFTGTPIYMAPEIILGHNYNYLVDLWSLGCVVVELCNLSQPYNHEDIQVVMTKIIDDPLPIISDHYTQELHVLVRQLLTKNASQRPEAKELLMNKMFIKYRISENDDSSSQDQQIDANLPSQNIIANLSNLDALSSSIQASNGQISPNLATEKILHNNINHHLTNNINHNLDSRLLNNTNVQNNAGMNSNTHNNTKNINNNTNSNSRPNNTGLTNRNDTSNILNKINNININNGKLLNNSNDYSTFNYTNNNTLNNSTITNNNFNNLNNSMLVNGNHNDSTFTNSHLNSSILSAIPNLNTSAISKVNDTKKSRENPYLSPTPLNDRNLSLRPLDNKIYLPTNENHRFNFPITQSSNPLLSKKYPNIIPSTDVVAPFKVTKRSISTLNKTIMQNQKQFQITNRTTSVPKKKLTSVASNVSLKKIQPELKQPRSKAASTNYESYKGRSKTPIRTQQNVIFNLPKTPLKTNDSNSKQISISVKKPSFGRTKATSRTKIGSKSQSYKNSIGKSQIKTMDLFLNTFEPYLQSPERGFLGKPSKAVNVKGLKNYLPSNKERFEPKKNKQEFVSSYVTMEKLRKLDVAYKYDVNKT